MSQKVIIDGVEEPIEKLGEFNNDPNIKLIKLSENEYSTKQKLKG